MILSVITPHILKSSIRAFYLLYKDNFFSEKCLSFCFVIWQTKRAVPILFLEKFAEKIELFSEKVGKGISWLTFILVILVCYDVVSRYLFMSSSVAVQELQWHLFALIFLLAAAYTLKYDEHVRVDVIYSRFSKKTQAIINIVGAVLFLIPFCLLIIYASRNFVFTSFQMNETSPDPGGLPARYILKAILPISFFFVLFQGIAMIIRSSIQIKAINKNGE